jgi:anaphase-promoting complex subunit 3
MILILCVFRQIDAMMWCSLVELSELGIDITSYFQIEADVAVTVLSQAMSSDPALVNTAEQMLKGDIPRTKLLAENMSRLSAQAGGSPHTASALGLSSTSFHVPFSSPGSILNRSSRGMDTLHSSQLATSMMEEQTYDVGISYAQSNAGDFSYSRPSNKLFNIMSPALTPIQLQSPGTSFTHLHPILRQERELGSIPQNRAQALNQDVNRNLGFQDSVTSGMASTPVNADVMAVTPTSVPRTETATATTNVKKVNFGPTARLSFSNTSMRSYSAADRDTEADSSHQQQLSFTDLDEHPSKFLRLDSSSAPQLVNEDGNQLMISSTVLSVGTRVVAAMISVFGTAICKLMSFDCAEVIDLLHKLPPNLFASGLTHQLIGKAYFEMNDYKLSVLAYREMLRLEPFRTQGLEYLSSALWHLRRDKELCALAQQVADLDKLSPETWCVIGNCFSLQHEPDSAMRFFQRAIQLDESYPYAHTLLGHEYVHNEDFDRAVQSFRSAILHDQRHYNAWYGLGAIYYRQERFELAEYHFRRAMSINATSSVLACYLAMVLQAQNQSDKTMESLSILQNAITRDTKNPQLHFQRAHILFAIDEIEEAVHELELVRNLAPREPPVYSMLGRAYQRLGRSDEALKHFLYAMDLDPREGTALKADFESLGEASLQGLLDPFL